MIKKLITKGVEITMTKYIKKLSILFALIVICLEVSTSVKAQTSPANPPAVGTSAPNFKLPSNEGNQISLKNYHGQWVVLYFYPKDFSSGCTLEAHNFQRDSEKYKKMKAVVLGVSVDTAESHKSFCAKEGLNFKLLADTDARVSTEYGSLMERNGTKLSARNTFIIDPKGKIAKVFTSVKPTGHSDEVLEALAGLQKH